MYNPAANYTENSVGCSIQPVSIRGEDNLRRNFSGEIGTLHFVEVDPQAVAETHAAVWQLAQHISLGNLWRVLRSSKTVIGRLRPGESMAKPQLKVFLLVSPKHIDNGDEANATSGLGKDSFAYNCVEVMYKETHAVHLMPGREVFLDTGGIKGLLMFLKAMAESDLTGKNDSAA